MVFLSGNFFISSTLLNYELFVIFSYPFKVGSVLISLIYNLFPL